MPVSRERRLGAAISGYFIGPKRKDSDVATGSTKARNQAGLDGVASHPEDEAAAASVAPELPASYCRVGG
jgi:hypothetical protein